MADIFQRGNAGERNENGSFRFVPDYRYESENSNISGLDPRKIISIIFRYKWFILLMIIGGVAGAWYYADSLTPIYKSRGTLMISQSEGSPNDELSQIISQTTGHGTSTTLANELQVLQSRKFSLEVAKQLINEVPEDINDYPILWNYEEDGSVVRSERSTVASRIRSNLEFRKLTDDSDVIEISFKSPSPLEAAEVVNIAMDNYVETSTQQNRLAAQSTAEFLEKEKQEIKDKLQESEENLRKYMDSTGIVQVGEQATGLVNQRAELESELQTVDLNLETIEQTIADYESQLEKIKPGLSERYSEAIGPRIKSLQQELARYESERTLIITRNPGVLDRNPLPARLQEIDKQINLLKNEIKNLSDRLLASDEVFMGLDGEEGTNKIMDIQSRLIDLRIEQNQLNSRKEALLKRKEELDAEFNSLPEGMIDLAKLQRDVRINEELYMNVSRQFADMAVLKQTQFGFGRIIDEGTIPNSPVSPNKKLYLLVGFMLSGILSAGFITIKEFMDHSVNSLYQLRSVYHPGYMLTVVPTIEKKSDDYKPSFKLGKGEIPTEMVMLRDRSGITAESIRRLKNNIIYQHGAGTPPKTIAITSPEKGDGKTTLAANLGVAFAEEGYKTLLIDSDFRRPKLHTRFGLSNKMGIVNYINGNVPVQKLIQNTDLNTLKIIPAGRKIQRPENITSNESFKQLQNKLEELFDIIIFDTPPFGVISDSTALLRQTESTIVVARYRKSNKGMLIRTIEDLERIQANITNIVLNDFNFRKEYTNYYGPGYYRSLYDNYEAYLN